MGPRIIAPEVKPETLLAWVAALFLAACLFSHTVSLRMLLLAAGIVLASVTIARERNGIRAVPQIWLPFLLWGLWAAASIAWSVEPDRSEKEWRNEVFYTGAALWICFVGAQVPKSARIFLSVVGVGALAVCAISLYSSSLGFEQYLRGLHGGPGNHSSALLTLMPCTLMAAWYGRRSGWSRALQALCWVLAALLAASAWTTLNRTVWLGFALQLAIIGTFLLLRGRAAWSTRARVFGATLAVVLVAGTAAMILIIQSQREAIGVARAFEQDARFALWPEILERVRERPGTGYGFGRGLLRAELRAEFGAIDGFLWHAHNLFLEALIQLGVPGLFLFLLLLSAVLREGWRFARDSDPLRAACGVALLGVIAGMVVRNMTDSLFLRQNALLFWGVTGLLLALGSRRTSH